jgi:hypothetical protein
MLSRDRRSSRAITMPHARRGVSRAAILIVLVAVVIVVLVVVLRRGREAKVVTTVDERGTVSSTARSTRVPDVATSTAALAALPKPRPMPMEYGGCPAIGDGGDRATNALKNRGDSSAWASVPLDTIVALPWPRGAERRDRRGWSRADAATVARFEGAPVRVEGYVASAKLEGPESVNCHGADTDRRDWHLWLAAASGPARERSLVVETTPLIRARHPGWTLAAVRRLARDGTPVRVSGWLMLDPEHPDQVGQTRGTIWEIHPILAIEVRRGDAWVPLENDAPPRSRSRR